MTLQKSIFPQLTQPQEKSEFASWQIRACSFLIDYAIWYAVFALVTFIILSIYLNITGYGPARKEQIFEELDYILVLPKILIAALIGYPLLSKWQATPAQRLLGIYVCSIDKKRLENRKSILRFFLLILIIELETKLDVFLRSSGIYKGQIGTFDSILFSLSLTLFFISPIARTKERTGLHDMICNARVKYGKL